MHNVEEPIAFFRTFPTELGFFPLVGNARISTFAFSDTCGSPGCIMCGILSADDAFD